MEYPQSPPGAIVRSHTDDMENHSVFDFPLDPSRDKRAVGDDDYSSSDIDVVGMRGYGKKQRKQQPSKPRKKRGGEPPVKVAAGKGKAASSSSLATPHPYPSSISIQLDGLNSPPGIKSPERKCNSEFRSPATSPGEERFRLKNGSSNDDDDDCHRQPNSPSSGNRYDDNSNTMQGNMQGSELARYHSVGQHHFQSNRLSDAVDSYSTAIRLGLEELSARKGMISRLASHRDGNNGRAAASSDKHDDDDVMVHLGSSLAQVHADLGTTLEIAQRYGDAKKEWENGVGMLLHTCHVSKNDERVKVLKGNIGRMDRALSVKEERRRYTKDVEGAFQKLSNASNSSSVENKAPRAAAQDEARKCISSAIRKLLRTERDSMGENSYAHAKLRLKLAKVKCEGGDIDGGLNDANSAVKTLKSVLGAKHTLVGAACLFAATVHERRATMIMENANKRNSIGNEDEEGGTLLPPECNSLMKRALELYGDALGPLKYKYDYHNSEDDGRDDRQSSAVQPDIAEVYHKIAKLYGKKGSHASSVDAYHRSLEAYGATGIDRSEITKKSSSYHQHHDVHPEAAIVWHDLAELHLSAKEYSNAIYAADKSSELARTVLKTSYNERVEVLPILANQIAGDAYGGLGRHEDATRSYQEGYYEFKKISGGSSKSRNASLGIVEEARLLRKLGLSLFRQNKLDDAKAQLMDALRILRSGKEGESSSELPDLLADIGLVHITVGEYTEAMNSLRMCLKMYADRGVSDHSHKVERANQLFKEAKRGLMGQTSKGSSMMASPPHRSPTASARSPLVGTPQSGSTFTSLTQPSTNYSRSSTRDSRVSGGPSLGSTPRGSPRSGHGTLQTLMEEFSEADRAWDRDSKVSHLHSSPHCHGQGVFPKPPLTFEHEEAGKQEMAKLEEQHSYEMQHLKKQLEDSQEMAQQYQLRLKDVEAERDQEKKDKVFAAAAHRKEVDAVTETKMNQSATEAELDRLRKEVNVSETSYQELVTAIDDEKEKLIDAHESQVNELQNEIQQLRGQLKRSGGIENSRLSEDLFAKKYEVERLMQQGQKASKEIASLKSTNLTLQSEKDVALREVTALKERNDKLQSDNQRMTSELAALKLNVASSVPNGKSVEVKKLEFELQSERVSHRYKICLGGLLARDGGDDLY